MEPIHFLALYLIGLWVGLIVAHWMEVSQDDYFLVVAWPITVVAAFAVVAAVCIYTLAVDLPVQGIRAVMGRLRNED